MTVKELPKDISLSTVIVKTPTGKIGYWKSQWDKGVWLSNGKDGRIHPIFVDSLQECLDWEVIEDNKFINV